MLESLASDPAVRHRETLPARAGSRQPWPAWVAPEVIAVFEGQGISAPWTHQVQAADLAQARQDVVISTGTASGKSLAYLLPVISALRTRGQGDFSRPPTALYLAPTKALAADQAASWAALGLTDLRAATYDGDTPQDERAWIRQHAQLVLTNPDLLHHSLLPGHRQWRRFLRGLNYIVIDEMHHYSGVFGAQVAAVLRRLIRVAAHYGASPTFILASATTSDPVGNARLLTGRTAQAITTDASAAPQRTFLLWDNASPAETAPEAGEASPEGSPAVAGPPDASPPAALTTCGQLLAGFVSEQQSALAFIPARSGTELVAEWARERLRRSNPDLAEAVAAYRGGYLPEDRRELEAGLRSGRLRGVATTSALELGIDITGLDAVIICGWPGRRSRFWQQAGRAGRAGAQATVILVAGENPLDRYVVAHPEFIFGQEVEATVLDPDNPHVLAAHLCAAAAELPLTPDDLELFGPNTAGLLDTLVARKVLRRRPAGWFWTQPVSPTSMMSLRGESTQVSIVEQNSGRVLGTVGSTDADHTLYRGASYLHQGKVYAVRELDPEAGLALVVPDSGDTYTKAKSTVDISIISTDQSHAWGPATLCLGTIEVTRQVVSYRRYRTATSQLLSEVPLDLPERTLRTTGVWWTLPEQALHELGLPEDSWPGALHAAEHAAIGLLPLVAGSDRWDVGGVSTARHEQTQLPTVFVYDAHPGGAGFAQRGYLRADTWWGATANLLATCPCQNGCPGCVYSPKCGNGNEPLDKAAAAAVTALLTGSAPLPGATPSST